MRVPGPESLPRRCSLKPFPSAAAWPAHAWPARTLADARRSSQDRSSNSPPLAALTLNEHYLRSAQTSLLAVTRPPRIHTLRSCTCLYKGTRESRPGAVGRGATDWRARPGTLPPAQTFPPPRPGAPPAPPPPAVPPRPSSCACAPGSLRPRPGSRRARPSSRPE